MLRWIWLVLRHKWFVFLAGARFKVPLWLLLIHDLSKFRPSEMSGYIGKFCGDGNPGEDVALAFARSWNHHQKRNFHHWSYWVILDGSKDFPGGSVLEMPEKYAREMVADWFGASRAYEGQWPRSLETWKWWQNNFHHIRLHPKTRKFCEGLVRETLGEDQEPGVVPPGRVA